MTDLQRDTRQHLLIRADLSQRAVVLPGEESFIPSPMAGVERMMLDRDGGEVARATTIVRYAPNSYFPAHTHGGGEEFYVLEGVFSDEHSDYPAGTYVRNPPGTAHKPFTKDGCTIFVKLHQFQPGDLRQFSIDSNHADWREGQVSGLSELPLHHFGREHVSLIRWAPGASFTQHTHAGGEEMLVLSGAFVDEFGTYPAGSWIRNPPGSSHRPMPQPGSTILVKLGHLA